VYAFVITNNAGEKPEFFILRGETLLSNEKNIWGKWGRDYEPKHGRGIYTNKLEQWREKWEVIDEDYVEI
jgi:hypothetical protein